MRKRIHKLKTSKKIEMENIKLPYKVPTDIGTWTWWIVFSIFLLSSLVGLISVINLEGFKNGLWFLTIVLVLGFIFLKLHPSFTNYQRGN